jgi:hypothetical protein
MLQPIYSFYYLVTACFDAIKLKPNKKKSLKHTAINSSKKHRYAIKVSVKYNLTKPNPVNHCNVCKTEKHHEYTNIGEVQKIQTTMAAVRYVTSGTGLNEISTHLVFVGQSVLPSSFTCHRAEVFLEELTVVYSAGHSSSYYRSQRRMHMFLKCVHNFMLFTDH